MVQTWSGWKRFPDAHSGGHVEAPIGPGVYEVRHAMTGQVIAFGPAGNVAQALSELKLGNGAGILTRLFHKAPLLPPVAVICHVIVSPGRPNSPGARTPILLIAGSLTS